MLICRLTASVALAAVVATTSLVVLPAARAQAAEPLAHAPVSRSKTVIDVTKDTPFILVGDGQRLALGSRTAGGEQLVAAGDSLLSVPKAGVSTALTVDAAKVAVGTGAKVGSAALVLEQVTGPQGATFTATDPAGAEVLGSGQDAPHSLAVTAGSTQTVGATFSAAGRYTVTLHAELPVTGSDGATRTLSSAAQTFTVTVGGVAYQSATTLTATAQDDHTELTATVTPTGAVGAVEFYDGDDYLGYTPVTTADSSSTATLKTGTLADGAHPFRDVFVPTWVTDFTSSTGTTTLTVGDPTPKATAASTASAAPRLDGSSASSTAPSTTSARAAAATVAPAAVGDGPVVISTGNVAFTPKMSGRSADGKSFGSFSLGLLDKTGDYADQKWYAPDQAVLHLGAANLDGDTWSTTASPIDWDKASACYDQYPDDDDKALACYDGVVNSALAEQTTGDHAKLLLGPDQASADGGINSSFANAAINLSFTLSSATVPEKGRFRLTDDGGTVGWDTAWLDGSGTQTAEQVAIKDKTSFWGTSFTTPGTYCLTVTGSLTDMTTALSTKVSATYTVIVGDLPTTITPCAQPGSSGGGGAGAGPVVISAGNVALTPKMSGLSADGKNLAPFQMGLLDKSGKYADQKWYSPDQAVLHLGDANRDAASTWSTAHKVIDLNSDDFQACYDDDGDLIETCYDDFVDKSIAAATGNNTKLLLGTDFAMADGGINHADAGVAAGGSSVLSAAKVPEGGRFQATQPWEDTPAWDTATLDGGSQKPLSAGDQDTNAFWGATFTAPGTYCLTVTGSLHSQKTALSTTASATYTVIVGDLPSTITTCAQPGNPGGGGAGDGWHDEDGFSTNGDVTVLKSGHLDTRAWLNSAGNGLDVGVLPNTPNRFIDSHDLVLTGLLTGTVPQKTATADYSFIGPAGSTYWYWPQSEAEGYLWPGFSTENWKTSQLSGNDSVNLTLAGVDGPGDVVLYQGEGGLGASRITYDSRWGLPATHSWQVPVHSHQNWAFTAQGRYCLNFEASTQLANGSWIHGSGQLTAWVGDPARAKSVTPCDRDKTAAVGTLPAATVTPSSTAVLYDSPHGELSLQPEFSTQERLQLPARLHTDLAQEGTYRDPDDLVLSLPWNPHTDEWTTGDSQKVLLDTVRLPWGSIDGQITVAVGDVRGPGKAWLQQPHDGALDDVSSRSFAPSVGEPLNLAVSKPGVYCVPLTVTATPAGSGQASSVTKTLTVVAGSTDPSDASYVDRSTVTSCSRGQQVGPPAGGGSGGGSGGDLPDSAWDVPNKATTDSGATILNDGHIDVASLLDGDTLLTRVKDTTESADPTWRDPAKTVLQVLPGAKTSVPTASQYGFLGTAGSAIWQVSETQEEGLLWPGWSTESIPVEATKTGVDWKLNKVSGPGEFALYTSDPLHLGGVNVLYNTRDGITAADSYTIPKNAHVHGSWAFSAEGTYCLGFTRSTTLADGTPASNDFTLAVAVGRVDVKKVDPGKCFTDAGKPATQDVSPVQESGLTTGTAGGVQVLGSQAGFVPGQLTSVQVGASHAGQWVSVWLHSAPTWLGWAQVDASGVVKVRLPVDAAVGSHKLVVKTAAGDLVGWDVLAVVQATDTGGGSGGGGSGGGGTSTPSSLVCAGGGTTVISSGHLDYSTQVVNGKIESLIGDNSSGTEVFRDPAKTVLWLKPSSLTTLIPGFERVGAAGSQVYLGPQTQNPDLIWLGWSTQTLNASTVSSPVSWSLTGVDGPGTVKVFVQGEFGGVGDMVFDGVGTHTIAVGSHVHANWVFSAAGVYRLHFTQSATLANGQVSSDAEVVTIVVGDVDPVTAVAGGTGCVTGAGSTAGVVTTAATGTSATAVKAAAQCTSGGVSVISAGHLDWNTQVVGGKLRSLIGDDSTGTRLYRDPGSTVLWLKPSAKVTLPAGFERVGAAGATVWQVPQTQNYDLIWLGWSTELLNAANASGPVTWSLTGVDGPGTVKVYTVGTFGNLQEMVFDGPGTHMLPLGVHVHANWAFSAQGVYRLHFTQSTTLANGQRSSDSEVLTVAVGDVNPATALVRGGGCGVVSSAVLAAAGPLNAAAQAGAQAAGPAPQGLAAPGGTGTGTTTATSAPATASSPVRLLLAVLGALLLLAAAGAGILWRQRRRAAAGVAGRPPAGS